MKDDMEFEASMKSGITADVEFVRKNDELTEEYLKTTKNSRAVFLIAFLGAIAFFFINKIVMVVCALIGAAALFIFIRTKKQVNDIQSTEYIVQSYEEGLLVPGMIVKTLRPRPLCWGTPNQDEIRAALWQLEKKQEENSESEWEILKKIAGAYPDLKPDHILQLDEFYQPMGIKQYLDSKFVPVITEKILEKYPKTAPDVSYITDDIPAAAVYNKMIELALKYQVYEYIGTHCKGQDFALLSNPGYFTYIGDPLTFLEDMKDNNIAMTKGEYPLIAGSMVLTTKGCRKKKEFIPWQEIQLEAVISSLGEIDTMVNGKCLAAFKVNTQYYQNSEGFTKEELSIVRQIEEERLNQFLQELKNQFMAP